MITKQVIQTLYKKYRKQPKSPDCLDMQLLFDNAEQQHHVKVDFDNYHLVIGSIDAASPFHSFPLTHIHAIVPFEEWIAIVMHSSIIFLNRKTSKVTVHVRTQRMSLWQRIRQAFGME
jgi:hypothetical protein